MRQLSDTRYVRTADGVDLAHRIVGDGPVDLIWSFNQLNDVESIGQHPPILEYFDALAEFARVIVYDRRGMGRSGGDRGDLATDVDDLLALLDGVATTRPYLASAATSPPCYPRLGFSLSKVRTSFRTTTAVPWSRPFASSSTRRSVRTSGASLTQTAGHASLGRSGRRDGAGAGLVPLRRTERHTGGSD